MSLGHKESHMDQAGIEPTSAWWQTTWTDFTKLSTEHDMLSSVSRMSLL